jgi:hypothetical protein|nr:hypothetical protein [Kofleriaceae bacterium]
MCTDTFRRHARLRADADIHRVFASLRGRAGSLAGPRWFARLVRVARGAVPASALAALLPFARVFVRPPETWPVVRGHPLVVAHALASHLLASYPVPRFLASAWLADDAAPRAWFVAHARGARFRSLALPIAMTRRMEHAFLATPDHLSIAHALRRAEVLGVGGSPELARAVLATRLGDGFPEPARWRAALAWLARCGDDVDLAHVPAIIEFVHAHLHDLDLRGRTVPSVMRLVRAWQRELARTRGPNLRWASSGWRAFACDDYEIVELLDSTALAAEGRAMRNCVADYTRLCAFRRSSIWALRRRALSVLTIEVRVARRTIMASAPGPGMIVQVKGPANAPPACHHLDVVRAWARREGLRFV